MPSVVFAQHDRETRDDMTDIPNTNGLLAALPQKEFKRIEPSLEPFRLTYGEDVYKAGSLIKHVYFPNSGLVSLLSAVDERSLLEVGIVGREGMVGLPLFLGVKRSVNRALVQGSGNAMRLTSRAFNEECDLGGELPVMLKRFAQSMMSQISQSAVCFRFHSVEQRLARWLLMTSDRIGSNNFQLTQDFLSNMLGVRREAVNKSAVELQANGLIAYSRGQVTILSRRKLEKASCRCYAIIRSEEMEASKSTRPA